MTLTRRPHTRVRRSVVLGWAPRWVVTAHVPQVGLSREVGQFTRWDDAIKAANNVAVNAGVRIPVKAPRAAPSTITATLQRIDAKVSNAADALANPMTT